MKKLTVLILAISVITAVLLCFTADARSANFTVVMSSESVETGDICPLRLTITENSGTTGGSFNVIYNPAEVMLESNSLSDDFPKSLFSLNDNGNGFIRIVFIPNEGAYFGTDAYITLNFRSVEGFHGYSEITFGSFPTFINEYYQTYYFDFINGSVEFVSPLDIKDDCPYTFNVSSHLILNVTPGTDINTFTDYFEYPVTVNGNEAITTGRKVTLDGTEYTVIASGDIDGDGVMTSTDRIAIRLHILGLTVLENEALYAADMYSDGKIDILDYMAFKIAVMKQ